uniref:Si:ch211-173a9.6 n=1 Tax=Poecilia formosa TaxID=48698 RepID=A0A096M2H3_POEFO
MLNPVRRLMMLSVLVLLLSAFSPALAWIPVQDWESGNVTTSVDSSGQCVCHVFLPDTTFPADRVEHMQQVSKDLILEVEIQKNKMVKYLGKLVIYLEDLKQLEARLTILESSPDDYIKLDFEMLRIELREFEALVSQLKDSLNSSSPLFNSLYIEIHNMTLLVNQLETYDKSNLEVIRHQFAKLQMKLEECQKDQGNCNHTGILSFSNPLVVQFNGHLSSSYVYGGWGKDSKPIRGYENLHFYGAYTSPGGVYDFYFYTNYENLLLRKNFKRITLPNEWVGVGNNYIVHSNSIYYQHNSPFSMTKFNLTSSKYDYRVISDASASFSYAYSSSQNLDFAADETGLWIIYASDENKGKIVIAKIDEKSFGIENTWHTGVYKQSAGNAFMVCGVMYATRTVDINTEEIFYAYDTKTKQERNLSIQFKKFQESYSNLDYNPSDQKLYMYNNGYYVSYNSLDLFKTFIDFPL